MVHAIPTSTLPRRAPALWDVGVANQTKLYLRLRRRGNWLGCRAHHPHRPDPIRPGKMNHRPRNGGRDGGGARTSDILVVCFNCIMLHSIGNLFHSNE